MKKYRKPHRIKKKKSIIKNRFFWLLLLILIISIFALYFLLFSQFFKIEEILVSGNEKVSKEEIMGLIEKEVKRKKMFLPQDNIFLINFDLIKEDILRSFPQVAHVITVRDFPRKLRFTIQEREGVALFCKDYEVLEEEQLTSQKCFLLDKDGIIFEEVSGDNILMPKIILQQTQDDDNELVLGESVMNSELLLKILDIFSGAESLDLSTKEISIISDERINFKMSDDWEIYFNPEEDINWQLTKLEAVLENIPQDRREDLEYIELRFGNLAPFKYENSEE
jgi:cell division septal protein FtsQ